MRSVFSGKRGRQCSERRADAAGRLDQAPLIPPPARLHWQACRWSPPQRRQHLVQGGEEQLSILRREYQPAGGSSGSAFMSRRADQHEPPASLESDPGARFAVQWPASDSLPHCASRWRSDFSGALRKILMDLSAKHAVELWTLGGRCFEGVLLIECGSIGAGLELLRTAFAASLRARLRSFTLQFSPRLRTPSVVAVRLPRGFRSSTRRWRDRTPTRSAGASPSSCTSTANSSCWRVLRRPQRRLRRTFCSRSNGHAGRAPCAGGAPCPECASDACGRTADGNRHRPPLWHGHLRQPRSGRSPRISR
jgi:hypothetical protein